MSQKIMIKPLTRLLFAQGGRCFFCREPLPLTDASVEHLVARAKGGSDGDDNCVVCCKTLNGLLGCMSLKKKIIKARPQSSQRATKVGPERYMQVVANLKQRGSAKPRTVAKLKSTIAALFQNKLSPDEVNALVHQLQSRCVISIAGSKVTYA